MSTTFLSQKSGTGPRPMQDGPYQSQQSTTATLPRPPQISPFDSPQSPTPPAWLQAWRTLRKRPRWVVAGVLLGFLTGLTLARQQPVLYQATARILISGTASSRLRFNSRLRSSSAPVQVADQAVRIKDDAVLNQLIDDLDLLNDSHGSHSAQAAPTARASLLRQLRATIFVRIVPNTRVVSITFTGADPRFTAQLVNKLVDDFSQRVYQEHFESAERATQYPAAQLQQIKAEVQATQAQMIQVQRRLGNTGFSSEYSRQDRGLDDLTREAVEARTRRNQLENQLNTLLALPSLARDAALEALPEPEGASAPRNDNRADLHLRLGEAQAALAAASATLGPNNPQRQALQAEVDSLGRSTTASLDRRLDTLRAASLLARRDAQAADAALAASLGQAYGEGGDTLLYRKLLREFTFTRALYVNLYTRLRTATINAGLSSVQVQLVDAAQVPGSPLPSQSWLLLAEGTLIGLILGCTVSLASENFRPGLRTPDEVEAVTDLPSLATLPHLKLASGLKFESMSTARRNLTAIDHPSSPFAEALRILRLNLDLSGVGAEPRYILFTSSTPSEGKTTIAGNYAVMLAERGERVLLIDADMHRPNLHHRFGLSGRRGLANALSGQCSWQQAVQSIPEVPNLDLLVAGPVPPSPAALLSSPALLSLLRQAGRAYTHIVLDSPPVMAVNDGIMLSQFVDAVVFVVRSGKIDKHVVRLGRERLSRSGAPLAGIVFNGFVASGDSQATS